MTRQEFERFLDEALPLGGETVGFVATWDGERPRVRPLVFVRHGLRFHFATARCSAKVREMTAFPRIEAVVLLKHGGHLGQLRFAGGVVEITGEVLRAAWDAGHGYDARMYFRGGLEDPDLIAFRLRPDHVSFSPPDGGENEALPPCWFDSRP